MPMNIEALKVIYFKSFVQLDLRGYLEAIVASEVTKSIQKLRSNMHMGMKTTEIKFDH